MLKLNRYGTYTNSTKTNSINLDKRVTGLRAVSYGWWVYCKVIDGKVVFNRYRYSVTTSKHQRECMQLLAEHGIAVDLFVESPKSL